jgi:hypothetical protein
MVTPAIEQSRLLQPTPGVSGAISVTPDGMALPQTDSADPSDGSFGSQQILKAQERVREFVFGSDASVLYTSNVALTREPEISDSLLVVNVTGGWEHQLTPNLGLQMGLRATVFRYNKMDVLDFEGFGGGVGLVWAPRWSCGVTFLARYDFTELIDSYSHELLRDHQFTLVAQRTFVFGRAHALNVGLIGGAGISRPRSSQRDQAAVALAYHAQLSRRFAADLSYRLSGFFYNEGDRNDLNQVFVLSLNYRLAPYTLLSGFVSFGDNQSTTAPFAYDVVTAGGGLGLNVRF